jgi:hypothetical protein
MWKAILAWLLAKLQPAPAPAPAPVPPPPVPVPVPTPTPVPTPIPPPPVPPTPPGDSCSTPAEVKLGFRPNPRKLALGYKNMFDVTYMDANGKPCPTECGKQYNALYGEPEAWQTGTGFTRDPVERASNTDGYVLNIATNSEADWQDGKFKAAGLMTVAVSCKCVSYWRAQDGMMGTDGLMTGFGQNSQGYNIPK